MRWKVEYMKGWYWLLRKGILGWSREEYFYRYSSCYEAGKELYGSWGFVGNPPLVRIHEIEKDVQRYKSEFRRGFEDARQKVGRLTDRVEHLENRLDGTFKEVESD